MCWLKSDRWKAGIALAGMLLLLILMVWVPVSAAGAYERASGLAMPGTVAVQATPTANATITAEIANEQLRKLQLDNDRSWNAWFWNNGPTILSSFLSTLVIVGGALFGLWRWRKDQHTELEKRAEERFQKVVESLGDEKEEVKVGAAIMLRTFLQPGYEQFYRQSFDLAVAQLRLRHANSDASESLDSLSKALTIVFKESFKLTRNRLGRIKSRFDTQSLDASGIRLDHAFLAWSDLGHIWMREAFLIKANLFSTDLSGAQLRGANFSKANLRSANLSGADLWGANLSGADLSRANLSRANLSRANLQEANLRGAKLGDVQLLKETNLCGVTGLTKGQKEACKAKGAIVDEGTTTSPPQSPASPSPPSQSSNGQIPSAPLAQSTLPSETDGSSTTPSKPSNDVQAPSAPSAQVSTPSPGIDGGSATSSQQGPES